MYQVEIEKSQAGTFLAKLANIYRVEKRLRGYIIASNIHCIPAKKKKFSVGTFLPKNGQNVPAENKKSAAVTFCPKRAKIYLLGRNK